MRIAVMAAGAVGGYFGGTDGRGWTRCDMRFNAWALAEEY